jgi:hypothetical protein
MSGLIDKKSSVVSPPPIFSSSNNSSHKKSRSVSSEFAMTMTMMMTIPWKKYFLVENRASHLNCPPSGFKNYDAIRRGTFSRRIFHHFLSRALLPSHAHLTNFHLKILLQYLWPESRKWKNIKILSGRLVHRTHYSNRRIHPVC